MGVSINTATIQVEKYNFRYNLKKIIPKVNYLTHGIHPYTAKVIPHIPRYFLEKYTRKNEIILDPFCGSGTTLLETILLGRNTIGIDINPLAILISEVKTTPLDIAELSSAIQLIKERIRNCNKKTTIDFPNIEYWFCKKAIDELSKIKYVIQDTKSKFNEYINNFLTICLSLSFFTPFFD